MLITQHLFSSSILRNSRMFGAKSAYTIPYLDQVSFSKTPLIYNKILISLTCALLLMDLVKKLWVQHIFGSRARSLFKGISRSFSCISGVWETRTDWLVILFNCFKHSRINYLLNNNNNNIVSFIKPSLTSSSKTKTKYTLLFLINKTRVNKILLFDDLY